MTTRRRDPGGSWWWTGGGGGGGSAEEGQFGGGQEFTFGAMCENERRRRELAALGGYQLPEVAMAAPQNQQAIVDSDIFQLSYPRPRLRWTAELHDQFVKAVDELGGANKATPKAILSLMGVRGLTLYHLKSHLQKFRLGKTGRKLWRKEFIPANYYRKREDRLLPLNLEPQGPSISNPFDRNESNTLGAETYGNLHLLVEPQAATENFEVAGKIPGLINANEVGRGSTPTPAPATVKLEEEFSATQPALLPLFPPMPACGMMMNYSPEWSEYMEGGGGGRRPFIGLNNNASVDDYLNSYDFALTTSHESCRASMIFGSFFDEVASFSKVDADLAADANVVGVEPHHLSAGSLSHYYP